MTTLAPHLRGALAVIEAAGAEGTTRRDLEAALGRRASVVGWYLTQLRRKKRIERTERTHPPTYRIIGNPCSLCDEVCHTGSFCPRCKQSARNDRLRLHAAKSAALEDTIALREVKPYTLAQHFRVPLWDKTDLEGVTHQGLVTLLLSSDPPLLGPEWADRQKAALGGESEEW